MNLICQMSFICQATFFGASIYLAGVARLASLSIDIADVCMFWLVIVGINWYVMNKYVAELCNKP